MRPVPTCSGPPGVEGFTRRKSRPGRLAPGRAANGIVACMPGRVQSSSAEVSPCLREQMAYIERLRRERAGPFLLAFGGRTCPLWRWYCSKESLSRKPGEPYAGIETSGYSQRHHAGPWRGGQDHACRGHAARRQGHQPPGLGGRRHEHAGLHRHREGAQALGRPGAGVPRPQRQERSTSSTRPGYPDFIGGAIGTPWRRRHGRGGRHQRHGGHRGQHPPAVQGGPADRACRWPSWSTRSTARTSTCRPDGRITETLRHRLQADEPAATAARA